MGDVPERLLRRLDDLAAVLAARGDALALIALGSVGRDVERLDEHSDLDFFVVVEDAAKSRYLDEIDWLEAVSPVGYSFVNTVDGRKVLFADGLYAEYAVFTLDELRAGLFSPGRLVWRRADAPDGLEHAGRIPEPSPLETPDYHVGEALTTLYVGLQRESRGERLAATRLIQVEAVGRLLALLDLTGQAARPRQDAFAVERGAEGRFPPEVLPLAAMVPGYERNREAALAVLDWLESRTEVDPLLARAIRELALANG
jgi:hypothetical protein